jgi:hypothetical protein
MGDSVLKNRTFKKLGQFKKKCRRVTQISINLCTELLVDFVLFFIKLSLLITY